MSHREMKRLPWLVAWLGLLTGCAEHQPARSVTQPGELDTFSEPTIAISPPDGTGTFRFSLCGRTADFPSIGRIVVAPSGARVGESNAAPSCIWSGVDPQLDIRLPPLELNDDWKLRGAPSRRGL